MDKIKKRLITYVVCMAVLLTAIPLHTIKAESTTPAILLNDAAVMAGNYFYSYLCAKNFENISALKLTVRYDAEAFEYNTNYTYSLLDGSSYDVNAATPGELHISVMNTEGITGSGSLFELGFRAKSTASAGTYYLKISVDEAYDADLKSISIGKNNGIITVKEATQSVETISFLGNCTPAKVSYGASVNYIISNMSGSNLAGGTFTVQYDADKLAFDKVAKGTLLDKVDALCDVNDNGLGNLRITFISDQNIFDSYGSDLLQISFTVKETGNGTTKIITTPSNLTQTNLESLKAASFETSLQFDEKKEEEVITDEMSLALAEKVSDGVFAIDTILHSEKGIAAGDFVIQYDKQAVKCKSITKNDSVSETGSYLVTKEKIDDGEVAFSLVNINGLIGDYTLLHLEFEVIDSNVESTIISINGQDVVGVTGDELKVKFNPVTVEVPTPVPSITPTATPTEIPETATPTASVSPSAVPTITPTVTPTEIPGTTKPTASASPSAPPLPTPVTSITPTIAPTEIPETAAPTATSSITPTASPLPSVTPVANENISSTNNKKNVKISKPVIKKVVNIKRKKLRITLKKMSQVNGFQCYYSTKKSFKKKKKMISRKSKFILKKLSKKRYYIKVRAFRIEQNGIRRFGKWSKVKKIKVRK